MDIVKLLDSLTMGETIYYTGAIGGGAFVAFGSFIWAQRFRFVQEKIAKVQAAAFYSELDRFYADLLKIAIEHPHLRTPARLQRDVEALHADYDPYPDLPVATSEQRAEKDRRVAQYDAYAFLVWNFLETIHDRCQEYPEQLLETWATIVAAENRVHRGWFLQQMRKEAVRAAEAEAAGVEHEPSDKFCKPFQVFVFEKNFLPVKDRTGPEKYPKWNYDGREDFTTTPDFGLTSGRASGPQLWPQAEAMLS